MDKLLINIMSEKIDLSGNKYIPRKDRQNDQSFDQRFLNGSLIYSFRTETGVIARETWKIFPALSDVSSSWIDER